MILLIMASDASATLVRRMNVEELTASSERVVYATVQDIKSEGPSGSRKFPSTAITFLVHDTWKGQAAGTVVLRQLTNDPKSRIRAILPMPVFKKGEKVVVFLSKQGRSGMSSSVGLEQGVFRVTSKESAGRMEKLHIASRSMNKNLTRNVKSKKVKRFIAEKKIDPTRKERQLVLDDLKKMVQLCVQEPNQ